jgi:phosphoglycerate dehydrogenase-like enzyme
MVTPHLGWGTGEARLRLAGVVLENVVAWLGGRSQNRVV